MEILAPYLMHSHVLPNASATLPDGGREDLALIPGDELRIFSAGERIILEKLTVKSGRRPHGE